MGEIAKKPLISVIVPIYKVEKYLQKCIDSILSQTYENLEIILVDDGSPDSCGIICDEYEKNDSRIKVIHKRNGGLADARNTGMKEANGQYIAFIDGDDWIDPDYYLDLYTKIDDCDVLICGYKSVNEQGKEIELCTFEECSINPNCDMAGKVFESLMYTSALGFAWNKLYKAELVKTVKFEELMPREDIAFNLLVISKASKVKLIGSVVGYNWVQHLSSITHTIGLSYVDKTLNISDRLLEIVEASDLKCKWSIYDYVMKVLLADTILVGVISNTNIEKTEKKKCLHKLLKHAEIGKHLRLKNHEPIYFQILWLCFKVKSVSFLYCLSIMALKR